MIICDRCKTPSSPNTPTEKVTVKITSDLPAVAGVEPEMDLCKKCKNVLWEVLKTTLRQFLSHPVEMKR